MVNKGQSSDDLACVRGKRAPTAITEMFSTLIWVVHSQVNIKIH